MLAIGTKAPNTTVLNQNGDTVSLSDYAGKWVVLYFYPKDDTPGCTTEACSFRDYQSEIAKLGAVVIGVSKDPVTKHQRFIEKHDLNFPLWSDEGHVLLEAFGAWGERSLYGRIYMGILRSTFIINPSGKIAYVWEKVTPKDHGKLVLEKLRELMD